MSAPRPDPPLPRKGEPAPWFRGRALSGADAYAFDTAAGRHVLMLFLGTGSRPESAEALRLLSDRRSLFDDFRACFFGITVDPSDEAAGRIAQSLPGIRWFLDYDRAISSLYGAQLGEDRYRPYWLLLDPMLRVAGAFALPDGRAALDELDRVSERPAAMDWAPVLLVPDILEPALCRDLIGHYRNQGGEESGFMRDLDGRTVLLVNAQHKVRRDVVIEAGSLQDALKLRVRARLAPMVQRIFQFEPTRMERYLIGCYEAEVGGHFRPHRDNTTLGTAHRRFAVTINLNAEDYEGGDLRFPDFGGRTYRAPTGGAIVFSCSLLHEATPVTRGTRYAFLPFLYDDEAARIREANSPYLEEGIGGYTMAGETKPPSGQTRRARSRRSSKAAG